MIDLIKETYVPKDYGVQLHRRKKILKQKDMDVGTYTEEFLKLCMKTNMAEDEEEKLARYMNGLKVPIKEELSLDFPTIVNKCYQMALKVEDKLKRMQDFGKGKNNDSGNNFREKRKSWNKGQSSGSNNKISDQGDKENSDSSSRGKYRGRRHFNRGRTNAGRGNGPLKCFN